MKKIFLVLLLLAAPLLAQTPSNSGSLTAQASTCVIANTTACVSLPYSSATGAVTVTLGGSFSATIQFEALGADGITWSAINATPLNSTTAVTSATAAGVWRINGAGAIAVRARCSTFVSGPVLVAIHASTASIPGGGAGGGGGGGITNSAGANVVMKSDGTNAVASSITDNGTLVSSTEEGSFASVDIQTGSLLSDFIVAASGVTANLLVALDASGHVATAGVNAQNAIGPAMTTQTSGQTVSVAIIGGLVTEVADGTITAGHFVAPGGTTAGRVADTGQTSLLLVSCNVQVIGKATASATVGNPVTVATIGPGHFGGLQSGVCIGSGGVALTKLATQAANTSVANVTSGTASPTAAALPAGGTSGCSGTTDKVVYTAGTGWSCGTLPAGTTVNNVTCASGDFVSGFTAPNLACTTPAGGGASNGTNTVQVSTGAGGFKSFANIREDTTNGYLGIADHGVNPGFPLDMEFTAQDTFANNVILENFVNTVIGSASTANFIHTKGGTTTHSGFNNGTTSTNYQWLYSFPYAGTSGHELNQVFRTRCGPGAAGNPTPAVTAIGDCAGMYMDMGVGNSGGTGNIWNVDNGQANTIANVNTIMFDVDSYNAPTSGTVAITNRNYISLPGAPSALASGITLTAVRGIQSGIGWGLNAIGATSSYFIHCCTATASAGSGAAYFEGNSGSDRADIFMGNNATISAAGSGHVNADQINATSLSGLATGILKNTTSTGVPSIATASDIPVFIHCQPGLGDGLNAMAAGTYPQSTCYNDSGKTWTITAVKCFTDNNGTSALTVSGNTLGSVVTSFTCSNSFASSGSLVGTALTSGDYLKFSFVADGTSKQTTWVVSMTQ